jgi:hypothetical protein
MVQFDCGRITVAALMQFSLLLAVALAKYRTGNTCLIVSLDSYLDVIQ